jgi:D-galactarolactone cycloisomerase
MRIRDIKALGLSGATPKGGWASELQADDCVHTLILVLTDEDLVGVGSVFNGVDQVRAALGQLEPLYLGEHALEPERLSEGLHQNTFWIGRGGSITHTIGGIDTALWDLLGKATGQPAGRLLGGRYREKARAYASLLFEEPKVLEARLGELLEHGFRAFKLGWGLFGRVSPRRDEDLVRLARTVVGDEVALMVDAGGSDAFWPKDLKWAMRSTQMLAEYGVGWFEEPLHPDDIEGHAALRRASPVAIAGGEVLTRRQSFQPWLKAGALDIVQPDVTKVGGLSEARRIGWLAEAHGARLIPHGWNTAVGLAADLQLASALPHTDLVEYLVGSPYIDEICGSRWTLDEEGMLSIPEEAGLGIALDYQVLRRYSPDAEALKDIFARSGGPS